MRTHSRYDDGGPDLPDAICEVCGREAGSCICPECPTCGVAGDPACYANHGLRLPRDGPGNRLALAAFASELSRLGYKYEGDGTALMVVGFGLVALNCLLRGGFSPLLGYACGIPSGFGLAMYLVGRLTLGRPFRGRGGR